MPMKAVVSSKRTKYLLLINRWRQVGNLVEHVLFDM